MTRTPIEWCRNQDGSQGFTVNPIRFRNKETGKVGHYCEKVSPGCKNCYASRMQKGPYLSGLEFIAENKDRGELFFDENVLQQVLRRQKPSTFFWCDMTDLFGEWIPTWWINRIDVVCLNTPQHRHLWLTKRPKRMCEYMGSRWKVPLPNLGLGVSAEDQERADERIPDLLQTPAAMRFVSVEPMLSNIDLGHWIAPPESRKRMALGNRFFADWIICGGESGPGARPMHPDWPRSVRDQCQAAGVPFFMKQWGEWLPLCQCDIPLLQPNMDRYKHQFAWRAGSKNDNELPISCFRVGKNAAGHFLDGRTWDELPEMLR